MIRLIYMLCLTGATFNHLQDLIHGGWLPYHYAPFWTNVFWTSLTFIDPLAIVLLWWHSSAGIWLTLGIMLADVTVNLSFGLAHSVSLANSLGLLAQVIFLGFVLGSASTLLQAFLGDAKA